MRRVRPLLTHRALRFPIETWVRSRDSTSSTATKPYGGVGGRGAWMQLPHWVEAVCGGLPPNGTSFRPSLELGNARTFLFSWHNALLLAKPPSGSLIAAGVSPDTRNTFAATALGRGWRWARWRHGTTEHHGRDVCTEDTRHTRKSDAVEAGPSRSGRPWPRAVNSPYCFPRI